MIWPGDVTPGGNTQTTLISLPRIGVRGLANFTDTNLARPALVYAPEPGVALLLTGAASSLARIGQMRRRAGD